jgi:hypothetical protein
VLAISVTHAVISLDHQAACQKLPAAEHLCIIIIIIIIIIMLPIKP